MKSVAILICTYRGEKHIRAQIETIVQQTDTEWCIYASDDASDDATRLIPPFPRAEAGLPTERCSFQVMDAHALTFRDRSFDYVIGEAILHHLDLAVACGEMRRVLRPGGRALFIEPLADNPLLRLFRVLTPSARTTDERPLSRDDLGKLEKESRLESDYYGLLVAPTAAITSIVLRWAGPDNLLVRCAASAEQRLSKLKAFQSWNQHVFLNLVRPD